MASWPSFLCILLLQSDNKVNTSRKFLVGCSDCRFLVQLSPLALVFQIRPFQFVLSDSALHALSMTMILVLVHQEVSLSQQIDRVIGFEMNGISADKNLKSFLKQKVNLFTLKIIEIYFSDIL